MDLRAGTRFGPYDIVAPIGAGGMGEVFRARDARLNREVAIKLLPIAFARDSDRVARFRREAQLVAALNHPNIAAIHGVEEDGDTLALALELVEGEDLAQRLRRGLIPIDEVIAIARQIAEGLEAAHEKGIVHRDLKPANIKLKDDGTVKILDFGLARSDDEETAGSEESFTNSPTMARGLTGDGVILGTAAYMSPEQARGKTVDKRSDIWAFGVVLHEMLTGKQMFRGETVSDTLAAVLRQDIDLGALPEGTPPALRHLLERSLERDPKRRLRDIGEARVALERPLVEAAPDVTPARHSGHLAWGVAALLAVAVAALAAMQFWREPASRRPLRFTFEPPPGVAFDSGQNDFFTISPDGRTLAFTGRTPDGRRQLWVRPLDSLDARPLPDTDDALEPFWSPDSRSIAFGSKGKLKRVDLAGGRAATVADAPRLVGGSWSGRGMILFTPDWNSVLHRVEATGGEARPASQFDSAARETAQVQPSFLDDGTNYVYASRRDGTAHIVAASIDRPERKVLLAGVPVARYASGWLFYPRDGEQWAQRLDSRKLELTGEPVKLSTSGVELASASEIAPPAASDDGVVVWRRIYRPDYQLLWFDRSGNRLGAVAPPIRVALTMAPRLSPDGTRVAIQNRDSESDRIGIWVYDLRTGVPTRLSSTLSQFPQWSPDGTKVAWVFQRQGVVGIYERAADGSSAEKLVHQSGDQRTTFPADWSRDGRFMLYWSRSPNTRVDAWMLPLSGERKPVPLLVSEFEETGAQLSPDGRWVAYRSDVSGTYEIYLQSVNPDGTGGGQKVRVTESGGTQPRFRGDGRELFYIANDGQMMSVSLEQEGPTLRVSTPKALFRTQVLPPGAAASFEYDVTTDGQRFLVGTILDGPNAKPPSPVIVADWQNEP
jgi:serine/threonine protein kinase/Tol biopolymer transport system component